MSSQDEKLPKLLLMFGSRMAIQNNCVQQRQYLICSLHSNQQHKRSSLHYNRILQIPLKLLQIIIHYMLPTSVRKRKQIAQKTKSWKICGCWSDLNLNGNAQWPEMKVHCFVRKEALYENPFVSEFCNITPSAPPLPVDFGRQSCSNDV